jgi:hypothetical protein
MSSLKFSPLDFFGKYFGIPDHSQTEVVASQTRVDGSLTGEETVTDFWRRPISVEEAVISSIILVLLCAARSRYSRTIRTIRADSISLAQQSATGTLISTLL